MIYLSKGGCRCRFGPYVDPPLDAINVDLFSQRFRHAFNRLDQMDANLRGYGIHDIPLAYAGFHATGVLWRLRGAE